MFRRVADVFGRQADEFRLGAEVLRRFTVVFVRPADVFRHCAGVFMSSTGVFGSFSDGVRGRGEDVEGESEHDGSSFLVVCRSLEWLRRGEEFARRVNGRSRPLNWPYRQILKAPLHFIQDRAVATRLVMTQIASIWTAPGTILPAAFGTLITNFNARMKALADKEALLHRATSEWEAALEWWHECSVCVLQVARGAFRGTDKAGAWHLLRANAGSRERTMQKARPRGGVDHRGGDVDAKDGLESGGVPSVAEHGDQQAGGAHVVETGPRTGTGGTRGAGG